MNVTLWTYFQNCTFLKEYSIPACLFPNPSSLPLQRHPSTVKWGQTQNPTLKKIKHLKILLKNADFMRGIPWFFLKLSFMSKMLKIQEISDTWGRLSIIFERGLHQLYISQSVYRSTELLRHMWRKFYKAFLWLQRELREIWPNTSGDVTGVDVGLG